MTNTAPFLKAATVYDIRLAMLRKCCGISHSVSDAEIRERLKRPEVGPLLKTMFDHGVPDILAGDQ